MKTIFVILITFVIGIVVGEHHRGKGTFFVDWSGKNLYYGAKVKVKKSSDLAHFYNNNCDKITVIGLQASYDDNLAWVELENCKWTKNKLVFDTFSQDELELAK